MSEGSGILLLIGGLGPWEIGIVGGVVLLVFFGRRIPDVMRSLGRGVTQFKKGLRDVDDGTGGEAAAGEKGLPAPKKGGEDTGGKPPDAPPKS